MILGNFLKIHFFGKIITLWEIAFLFFFFFFFVCFCFLILFLFFSIQPLCPQEPECHLAGRHIIFIYHLYVSGILVLEGKAVIFTLMLI